MKKALFTFLFALLVCFNLKAQDVHWDGVDGGGVVVIPKAFAQFCKLNEEGIELKADVVKCINDILRLKGDESGEVSMEAKKLTDLLIRQIVYANIAEGMATKKFAYEYDVEKMPDLSEKLEVAEPSKELLTNLMMVEKESAFLQKNLLKVKSSEIQFNSFFELSNYKGRVE